MIYRNDTLIHNKPAGGQHHLFVPGKYRVVSNNGFTIYPQVEVTFYIRSLATPVGEIASSTVSWLVYPNPASGNFIVQGTEEVLNGSLTVFDVNGKQVWTESNFSLAARAQYLVPAEQWKSGLYVLQLTVASGSQRFRIMKN